MSNIGITYQLEARVNIAVESSSCSICGCWIERRPGSTETYIAGSHSWVCAECADGIDHDLAVFAYRPDKLPRQRPKERHPEYLDDGCPACGRIGGKYLNIGKHHWKYCERHGLKWYVDSDLFSSWQHETEADWIRNREVLIRCREVALYSPRLPLRTRAQRTWEKLMWRLNRIGNRFRPALGDDRPF
jgi:hypothetical protein